MPFPPGTKCFLFAWVPAWGAGIFLASAMIASFGFAEPAAECAFGCTFEVADAISPQAKLAFGAVLGALMWLARRRRPRMLAALMTRDAASGAAAATVVLALLPGGFGVSLADIPGWPMPSSLYLLGAAAGGMLGTLLERSCRRNLLEE